MLCVSMLKRLNFSFYSDFSVSNSAIAGARMISGKPSYILGINAYDHDVSACLLKDGEIVCAINKERVTREKNATGFYEVPATYCLDSASISLAGVEYVVRNCY